MIVKDRCRNHPARSGNQKPLPRPSRKTVSFRFPLKDYASKLTDLRSPHLLALPWQISKAAAPFRFLACPLLRAPFPQRGRPAQTLHSTHGFGNFQASRLTRGMLHACPGPGMNPSSRAAPR
jgi:hypothetical protein